MTMTVYHDEKVEMSVDGTMYVIAEDTKSLPILSTLYFDDQEVINLEGKMIGVYENVFRSDVLDLANIRVIGTISSQGWIRKLALSSIGIVGNEYCYKNSELLNSLTKQVLGEQ